MNPSFVLPARKTIRNVHLPKLFQEDRKQIEDSLKNTRKISTTTDLWSSTNEQSFSTVTAHYVDLNAKKLKHKTLNCELFPDRHNHTNIAKSLKKTFNEFGITEENRMVGVSDSGSDVKKAIIDDLKLPWWACFAHRGKNSVEEAVRLTPAFKIIRKKVSKVVRYIRKSNVAKLAFVKCQKKAGRGKKRGKFSI